MADTFLHEVFGKELQFDFRLESIVGFDNYSADAYSQIKIAILKQHSVSIKLSTYFFLCMVLSFQVWKEGGGLLHYNATLNHKYEKAILFLKLHQIYVVGSALDNLVFNWCCGNNPQNFAPFSKIRLLLCQMARWTRRDRANFKFLNLGNVFM